MVKAVKQSKGRLLYNLMFFYVNYNPHYFQLFNGIDSLHSILLCGEMQPGKGNICCGQRALLLQRKLLDSSR